MKARTSKTFLLLGAGSLLVAAGAGTIGASTTNDIDGTNRALSGSDALKGLVNDFITQLSFGHDNLITTVDSTRTPRNPGAGTVASGSGFNSNDGIYYSGGGQSVGDGDALNNFQQLAFGTASLKNTTYAYAAATGSAVGSIGWINADGDTTSNGNNTGAGKAGRELPVQGTTETLVIGLDGLTILGNTVETAGSGQNGLAVKNASLTVHHYVPSDARFFPGAGAGGTATETSVVTQSGSTFTASNSNQWVLPGLTFASTDVGTKLAVTGALGGGPGVQNNQIFTIATVVDAHTITTVQQPYLPAPPANTAGTFTNTENFTGSVNFTLYASRTFVVNDADTTFPLTSWGASGGVYTFNNSLDVLRLLYGGLHHDGPKNGSSDSEQGTFDAGSDVRRSLADSWGTLFQHAPATTTGSPKLSHAWRRPDPAGVSNAFVALVNFGGRGIGSFPSTTASLKTNPFANAGDANGLNASTHLPVQFPWNSTVKSAGGPADFADDDPIRRPAAKGPNPSTTSTSSVDLDQVAEIDGTLGLVLVAWPPDAFDGAQPTTALAYPTLACTTGKFDLLTLGAGITPTAANVPEGGPYSGLVFIPYNLDLNTGTKHYNCIQKSGNQKPFGVASTADNRVWNLVVRSDTDGHVYKDQNSRPLLHAGFFRIHTTLSNTLVTPGTPSSGLVLAKQLTSDAQEGALVAAEPYSVAFTARGVDQLNSAVTALSLSGQASLGTSGQFDPTVASLPTDQNIKNLVLPGATPVYPLARRLYLATLVGFTENPPWSHDGILKATGVDPGAGPFHYDGTAHAFVPPVFTWNGSAVVPASGSTDLGPNTAVRGLQGQEAQIARLFENSDHIGAAIKYWGFVPLPSSSEGYAANGVSALDYPEDAATGALPLNGAADSSGRYYATGTIPFNWSALPASFGSANFNKAFPSANNEDATVVSPPDAITGYSLPTSAPPFPYTAGNEPANLPW
jgi:hypothetical protein